LLEKFFTRAGRLAIKKLVVPSKTADAAIAFTETAAVLEDIPPERIVDYHLINWRDVQGTSNAERFSFQTPASRQYPLVQQKNK